MLETGQIHRFVSMEEIGVLGLKVGCLEEVALRKKIIIAQQAFDQMISNIPRTDLLECLKKTSEKIF